VKLGYSSVTENDRTNYVNQYDSLLANVKTFIEDANYNGKTLIGNITGSSGTFARVAVVRNESGASYGIGTYSGSALYGSIAYTSTQLSAATTVQGLIGTAASASFINNMNGVNNQLNTIGASVNYVSNQVSYNSDKIDALNTGIGALVDADLAQESAQLQALQIRQQLGTQALSLANQAPQTLLTLFKT
jgi:flagellin